MGTKANMESAVLLDQNKSTMYQVSDDRHAGQLAHVVSIVKLVAQIAYG